MGTRALVRVFGGDEEIVVIYRQFDGYPDGLGKDIEAIVSKRRIVNGISSNMNEKEIANGAGCLAAFLLAGLKESRPGSVYLHPAGTKDCGEEYEYHVKCPGFEVVDQAEGAAPFGTFQGVPVVVEAFEVNGGYSGKPRSLKRVKIGATESESTDG